MFDGGGQEAQRFFSTKSPAGATKSALLSLVFRLSSSIIVVTIIIAGMVLEIKSSELNADSEGVFVGYFFTYMPDGLRGLSLLAFFAAYITSAESQLNWGSSFLMVDIYEKAHPAKSTKHYMTVSFLIMFSLSCLGLIIAFFGESLHGLIQILFSISAGVAPVFILRWVWLRINAWSQLTAMLASIFYIVTFDLIPVEDWMTFLELDIYSLRILFVTICTTLTWLLVTFLTSKDDEQKLRRFRRIIPLTSFSASKIVLAVGIGIGSISVLAMVMYFLFDS